MNLAPILLFTYKRLDTLIASVDALKRNYLAQHSSIYIYSDAAKHSQDVETVKSVRNYLKSIDGFKNIKIIEAPVNQGLAKSVINGVGQVINQYGKVIVLEDDLIVTANFLDFMNYSLEFYEEKTGIFSLSGYNYNFNIPKGYEYDNYMVTRGCSWGWATWKDRWEVVDWQIENYKEISTKKFKRSFNRSGSDLTSMLQKQINSQIDSWAIRWYYNQWKVSGLTAYPCLSFVDNQGFDADATHTKVFNRYKTINIDGRKTTFLLNPNVTIDSKYQKLIQAKFSLLTRIVFGKLMTYLVKLRFNG